MSPEERAKALVPMLFAEDQATTEFRARVSTAINQAQDDKLEDVKLFIQSMADEHEEGSDVWAVLHVAAHGVGNMLSLKHKEL